MEKRARRRVATAAAALRSCQRRKETKAESLQRENTEAEFNYPNHFFSIKSFPLFAGLLRWFWLLRLSQLQAALPPLPPLPLRLGTNFIGRTRLLKVCGEEESINELLGSG